jgi:thiamine biosynthesis protein ThiS
MIIVKLNEQSLETEDNTKLADLVALHVSVQDFAIAVNQHFVPKEQYNNTTLKHQDQIELLVPMQGG